MDFPLEPWREGGGEGRFCVVPWMELTLGIKGHKDRFLC